MTKSTHSHGRSFVASSKLFTTPPLEEEWKEFTTKNNILANFICHKQNNFS